MLTFWVVLVTLIVLLTGLGICICCACKTTDDNNCGICIFLALILAILTVLCFLKLYETSLEIDKNRIKRVD